MIDKIKIQNYQSHENTELELSSGINVIIGETDRGKTSILRALNWMFSNRPLGEGFKCDKNIDSEVRVFISKGEWDLARIKNLEKNFNGYFLYHKKDNEKRFDFNKIGSEVPEPIKKALNLSSINYQSQLSNHFLIRESPGEVGRVINDSTRMVDIDSVMSWFEKELREKRNQERSISKDLENKKEEIKQYEGIELIGEKIERLLKLENKIPPIKTRLERFSYLVSRLDKLEKEEKESNVWIDKEGKVRELINRVGELKISEGRMDKISFGISELYRKENSKLDLVSSLDSCIVSLDKMKEGFIQEIIKLGFCPYCRGKIDEKKAEALLKGGE